MTSSPPRKPPTFGFTSPVAATAWSKKDVIVPVSDYGPNASSAPARGAFVTLPDFGHDPMMEDPELVAQTILSVTTAETPRA
jgi:pimeloyl-ACP methyl ester carboxylesterase